MGKIPFLTMVSKVKVFTVVLLSLVLILGCIVVAGCTSSNVNTSAGSETAKDTSASEVVGTWVEKLTDDQYMVYNVKADGNAEMITYVISTGKTLVTQTIWKNLGNRVYEIGNVRLTCDTNNLWHMSHQDSGVFAVSKYSTAITPHENIVDAVASVAKQSDSQSEKLERSITTAKAYLNMEPYSRIGLIEVMQKQNIDNCIEAVDKANIDWMRQADLAAEKWSQRGENTADRLTVKLYNLGFTDAEIQHGVASAKEKGLVA
ncbi:MAG TPA: hypothetical protein O0X32_02830 [Methanocorpusculum sp.]|nr:hypothetical protein [Methanocorpusculum sp.]